MMMTAERSLRPDVNVLPMEGGGWGGHKMEDIYGEHTHTHTHSLPGCPSHHVGL